MYETLEPVLNDKGESYWLTRIWKKYTPKDNRPVEEILKDPTSREELPNIPVFELKPQGLWCCRKCGAIVSNNQEEPIECYKNQGGCGRSSSFDVVTESITGDIENLWKLPKWQDIPIDDLDMLDVFDTMNDLSNQAIIFPEETLNKIYNLWIISSYHPEAWESVGWLEFLGLHDSGKTRALDYISELGYRMVHGGSGVTFPAMVRASHNYGAGILLDQAEKKLNESTETGRELLGFILPSYRRRSKYVVAHKENQRKTVAYNNFGLKAFASERGFNRALTSRCIVFQMERDYPEIAKLSYIQDDLDILQTKLLNYRYKFNSPLDLGEKVEIQGRIREIFEPIIATGKHIGVDVSDIIKYAKDMEKEKEEELVGSVEWEILNAIKGQEENETLFDAPEEISFTDICTSIGWDTDGKTRQKLGYIFQKKLLLKTKRKTHGTVLLLSDPKNSRRLKYLYRRYHV